MILNKNDETFLVKTSLDDIFKNDNFILLNIIIMFMFMNYLHYLNYYNSNDALIVTFIIFMDYFNRINIKEN